MDLFTVVCCVVAGLSALAWVGTKIAKLPLEVKKLKYEIEKLEQDNPKNRKIERRKLYARLGTTSGGDTHGTGRTVH